MTNFFPLRLVLIFLFGWPFFKDVTLLLGWAKEPVDGDVFQAEGNEVETCVHVLETYIFFLAWLEFKYVIWLIILGEGDPYSCCQQYGVCETICYFHQVFFKQEVNIFAWVRELFSTGGVCETIRYFQQLFFFKQEVYIFAWIQELFTIGVFTQAMLVSLLVRFSLPRCWPYMVLVFARPKVIINILFS